MESQSDIAVCPYNSAHRVLRYRLPHHLVKCQKTYQGEPLQRCPFNAMHLIKPGHMAYHLETCFDYYTSQREEYERNKL